MECYNFQEMLTIRQVADILKVKDLDTALRWLSLKGVPTHSELKGKRVYAFSFAFALDLDLAQTIRAQYPNNWETIYSLVACNAAIHECVLAEMDAIPVPARTTKAIQVNNIDEQKLMNKILGK